MCNPDQYTEPQQGLEPIEATTCPLDLVCFPSCYFWKDGCKHKEIMAEEHRQLERLEHWG